MKTREKILNVSLELFNKQGIQKVTQKDISGKINISVGNLNYHFPTTNDIIYALSLKLMEDINRAVRNLMMKPAPNTLVSTHNMMRTVFTTQINYKFLFETRYAEILSNIPKMREYAQESFSNHFLRGSHVFQQLVKEGFLKENILQELNGFIHTQHMISLYWQQELFIFYPELSDGEKIEQALGLAFQPYIPHLTVKGKATLIPLLKSLEPYKKDGGE